MALDLLLEPGQENLVSMNYSSDITQYLCHLMSITVMQNLALKLFGFVYLVVQFQDNNEWKNLREGA
jgi:hypothetical protein